MNKKIKTLESENRIRNFFKKKRFDLKLKQQSQASQKIDDLINRHQGFLKSRSIGFYKAINSEIDPMPLLNRALQKGQRCFLPRIIDYSNSKLSFAAYDLRDDLITNKWGIQEPSPDAETISPRSLDLVFLPLVAFDEKGHRIGMGKGFYDRTFAFKNQSAAKETHPFLIGLAHDCQKSHNLLPQNKWDIRLDAIVTPSGLIDISLPSDYI
ncbi:5-formyltetrahydrofolate cyclo-ligase [bacterium]|nr:5-formyltetrahydrofolate cyclo-ligase [bacterium]MDA9901213.1 5-formyltetrahydrofolate cyclo-ligase [Gammaproteobacteria bacterium]MDB2444170.1 5-formyltetrahydrofolate cyclo-ligase [Gammaproteobacteria bacterium]